MRRIGINRSPCSWVEDNLIGKTYGFKYIEHFRPMLCSILGDGCVGALSAACGWGQSWTPIHSDRFVHQRAGARSRG
jgi:hypothetical protein